ncbi:hypothetical protein C8R42DRAFT_25082 [Lentinula raphanica]|nr:hypothetical protein C8R42DRAFT_25082 [Lentinula raphanica]
MTDALINLEDLSTCEENTQPIQSFRLFTGEFYCGEYQITALEYHWGLEKGELDLWCPLNRISVRADVAPLFLDWELALVPTVEVLQTLANTVEANFLNPTDQRRSCFEVLPPGEYDYDLVPVRKNPPNLFLIGNSSSFHQRLEFAHPHFPRVKLNVHPTFAVVHGVYQLYPSVHRNRPYFTIMSVITAVCYSTVPRDFQTRPNTQLLPRRISGQDDDQRSFESDDSEEIIEDDDYSGEDDGVRIQSWLEGVPKSISLVEEVSGKSEGECSKNSWRNSPVKGV